MKRTFDTAFQASAFSTLPSAPFSFLPSRSQPPALTAFSNAWTSTRENDETERDKTREFNKKFAQALLDMKLGLEAGLTTSDPAAFEQLTASVESLADEAKITTKADKALPALPCLKLDRP